MVYTLMVDKISNSMVSYHPRTTFETVAASFMTFHVASDAECFAAALVRALEWFLACVWMAVNPQTGWSGECLVAGLTDISVLGLWEWGCGWGRYVVVMLPWISTRWWSECYWSCYHCRWKLLKFLLEEILGWLWRDVLGGVSFGSIDLALELVVVLLALDWGSKSS